MKRPAEAASATVTVVNQNGRPGSTDRRVVSASVIHWYLPEM